MEETTFRKYVILGQIALWAMLFLLNLLYEMDWEQPLYAVFFALTGTVYLVPIVYIHYFKLLPILQKGHRLKYGCWAISLISFFIIVYWAVDELIPTNHPEEACNYWSDFLYYFFFSIIVTAFSSLFYFVEAWHENFKKSALLKSEKLQTELNFLKSQINPHFLFNTLNNIYAYAQTGNEKTAPMLERLSSILRFMVYEGSEDRVALKQEIKAIENLLEIHKMKNSQQQNIHLVVNNIKGYHLIAPLILVNFVENACKHSDTISNPKGFLNMEIWVDEKDNCHLKIANTFKLKNSIRSKYQGVGLSNIKKRLELQYGEQYTFSETKENNVYQLRLMIPLERKM